MRLSKEGGNRVGNWDAWGCALLERFLINMSAASLLCGWLWHLYWRALKNPRQWRRCITIWIFCWSFIDSGDKTLIIALEFNSFLWWRKAPDCGTRAFCGSCTTRGRLTGSSGLWRSREGSSNWCTWHSCLTVGIWSMAMMGGGE